MFNPRPIPSVTHKKISIHLLQQKKMSESCPNPDKIWQFERINQANSVRFSALVASNVIPSHYQSACATSDTPLQRENL